MAEQHATRYRLIDVEHMGRPEAIAVCLLETGNGAVLVDPGPASTVPRLREGLDALGYGLTDLHAVLLTHIHLDHAGGSGTLARECPDLTVYVHESGAPHVIDPSKLLASATRLYGDRMEALWGEVAPVPAERVRALQGGERLALGSRALEVAYTPGHAWHHVSYYEAATGVAFVGDTAGIRSPQLPVVLPVTPPPDFDLEAWKASIERILAWRPSELFLTHFGPSQEPADHLSRLAAGLDDWARLAKESLSRGATDAERIAWFTRELERWLEGRVDPALAGRYLAGAGPDACWRGLHRYWTRRSAVAV